MSCTLHGDIITSPDAMKVILDLRPSTVMVFLFGIVDTINDGKYRTNRCVTCWIPHELLAEKTNLSVITCKRATAELVEDGIVHREHRYRKGKQTSNLYTINVVKLGLADKAAPKTDTGTYKMTTEDMVLFTTCESWGGNWLVIRDNEFDRNKKREVSRKGGALFPGAIPLPFNGNGG